MAYTRSAMCRLVPECWQGHRSAASRQRPLHQVLIQKADLPSFYGVCVSPEQGAFTPVIITTHFNNKKQKVWYLGGDIATKGVERTEKEQIQFAQNIVWCDYISTKP